MRKHSRIKSVGALKAALAACVALASFGSTAQSERWFTFEVSVFSNELASDRAQELPIKKVDAALYNGPVIHLTQFFDLLNIAQWPDQTATERKRELDQALGNVASWRAEKKEMAASALKLAARELLELGLVFLEGFLVLVNLLLLVVGAKRKPCQARDS